MRKTDDQGELDLGDIYDRDEEGIDKNGKKKKGTKITGNIVRIVDDPGNGQEELEGLDGR